MGKPSLAKAIAEARPFLHWVSYDAYPREDIGAGFADNHAFASIIGEGCPIEAVDFDLGLFIIAPHLFYRDHHHAAPELYAPLTGPHGWRFKPGDPLVWKEADRSRLEQSLGAPRHHDRRTHPFSQFFAGPETQASPQKSFPHPIGPLWRTHLENT